MLYNVTFAPLSQQVLHIPAKVGLFGYCLDGSLHVRERHASACMRRYQASTLAPV